MPVTKKYKSSSDRTAPSDFRSHDSLDLSLIMLVSADLAASTNRFPRIILYCSWGGYLPLLHNHWNRAKRKNHSARQFRTSFMAHQSRGKGLM